MLQPLSQTSALLSTPQVYQRGVYAAGAVTFKYVLLDASTKQAEVLDQAHSVVLASGTLAPLELLTQQLCRAEDLPRLHKFTCGHIVPEERVTAVSLGCGPTGKTIKLTHGARDAHATMDECGLLMNNLCRMVPQGLVVFVSSFAYSDSLRHRCVLPLSTILPQSTDRPPYFAALADPCAAVALHC